MLRGMYGRCLLVVILTATLSACLPRSNVHYMEKITYADKLISKHDLCYPSQKACLKEGIGLSIRNCIEHCNVHRYDAACYPENTESCRYRCRWGILNRQSRAERQNTFDWLHILPVTVTISQYKSYSASGSYIMSILVIFYQPEWQSASINHVLPKEVIFCR